MIDDQALSAMASRQLSSMTADIEITATANGQIRRDATHPALQTALEKGALAASAWQHRITRAREHIAADADGKFSTLWIHYEASRRRRRMTPDASLRDLMIVADGQIALHHWIAAFASMAQYARHVGHHAVAWDMTISAEEATMADERQALLTSELIDQCMSS